LHAFLGWVVPVCSRPSPTIAPFDDTRLPRLPAAPAAARTAEQLQMLREQLAAQDQALAARVTTTRWWRSVLLSAPVRTSQAQTYRIQNWRRLAVAAIEVCTPPILNFPQSFPFLLNIRARSLPVWAITRIWIPKSRSEKNPRFLREGDYQRRAHWSFMNASPSRANCSSLWYIRRQILVAATNSGRARPKASIIIQPS